MGGVIGKTSTDIGSFIGDVLTAPFKATLGRSCVDVCLGPWDVTCFVEHFCIPDIAKLVMISGLCFIILMFFTLSFKLGICQCIVKSICKMSCAACAAYWCAIGDMVRCLWHSLKNIKRVSRRRRVRDIEAATYDYPSGDDESSWESLSPVNHTRTKRRRRDKLTSRSKHNHHHHHHDDHDRHRSSRHVVKLRSRQMSIRVGGKSRRRRSMKKMKLGKERSHGRKAKILKDVTD